MFKNRLSLLTTKEKKIMKWSFIVLSFLALTISVAINIIISDFTNKPLMWFYVTSAMVLICLSLNVLAWYFYSAIKKDRLNH